MRIRALFSEADLEAIREATASGERRTAGEIVPYIVERVIDGDGRVGAVRPSEPSRGPDRRRRPRDRRILGRIRGVVDHPADGRGRGLGYLMPASTHRPRLIPKTTSNDRAPAGRGRLPRGGGLRDPRSDGHPRFLALFEHRAVILADEGIHRAVPKDEWQQVIDDLITGIKRVAPRPWSKRSPAAAAAGAVQVERRPDDEDELSDAPRIRER